MAGRATRRKSAQKANVVQEGSLQHRTLERKRSNILGSANLIKEFLATYTEEQVLQVPLRIQRLDELWEHFEAIQDEIEVIEGAEEEYSVMRQEFHDQLKAGLASKIPEPPPPPLPLHRLCPPIRCMPGIKSP